MRPLNHENIVKLYDYFETTRCNYLVLEYCSGGDLKNRKQIGEA